VGTITLSGNTYDVHGTEAGAKAYFRGHPNPTAWDGATADQRRRAHIGATRIMEGIDWTGELTAVGQALSHPRTGMFDCEGNAIASNVTWVNVEEATYEVLLSLLEDVSLYAKTTNASNVKSVGAGSARVSFWGPGDPEGGAGSVLPPQALRLVSCIIENFVSQPFAGGTAEESQFDDCDEYRRNEGLA